MVATARRAQRVRFLGLAAGVCLAMAASGATGKELGQPQVVLGIDAAKVAYGLNLALGDSLAGKAASAAQIAEAQRDIDQGLALARSAPEQERSSAAAHRIIGLLLCAAYRPVKVKVISNDKGTGQLTSTTMTVLKRGNADQAQRDEGLAELRLALRTDAKNTDYQLDYAEALLVCEQGDRGAAQLNGLWAHHGQMTAAQRARAVHLLAQRARGMNQAGEEIRWLREALMVDPKDGEAARRLMELMPKGSGITWLGFEEGMAVAGQAKKPVMMDFSTSWCVWCKKLEADVFSQSEAIKLSDQFVCIRVDGDARRDLVQRYRVDGYPTIVFLNRGGQPVHRIGRYEDLAQFLSDMKQALAKG